MKVFISATREDVKAYRSAVEAVLQQQDHQPLMRETAPPGSNNAKRGNMKLIQQADVFIGIYAHRYGEMPKGEAQSLLEQEYRHAVKLGKSLICCVIDSELPWPDEHREDDFIKQERLEKFLAHLTAQHQVIYFRDPDQLVKDLTPLLQQYSEKYDRLKKLRQWAAGIAPKRKLQLVRELIARHRSLALSQKDLTDTAFITATRLIAGDFDTGGRALPDDLLDETERLLKGEVTADGFVKQVNRFRGLPLKELLRRHSQAATLLLAAVMLTGGMYLGGLFRPAAPAGETALPVMAADLQAPFTAWLLQSQITPALDPLDPGSESSRRALALLRAAQQQQPDHPALAAYCDSLVQRVETSANANLSAQTAALQELCAQTDLPVFCEAASRSNRRLAAQDREQALAGRVAALNARLEAATLSDSARLQIYRTLLDSFPEQSDPARLRRDIAGLTATLEQRAQERRERQLAEQQAQERRERQLAEQQAAEAREAQNAAPAAETAALENPPAGDPAIDAGSLNSAAATPAPVEDKPAPPPAVTDPVLLTQIAVQKSDTVTVQQSLANWQAFAARAAAGAQRSYAEQEIRRLETLIAETAMVRSDSEFVTCREVNRETRMPEEITDDFSPGQVWAWMRIRTPRADTITARWYVNGRLYHTNTATIPGASGGYRIYFSKTHDEADSGRNEIRLYNADDLLIGRAVYRVGSQPVTRQ